MAGASFFYIHYYFSFTIIKNTHIPQHRMKHKYTNITSTNAKSSPPVELLSLAGNFYAL